MSNLPEKLQVAINRASLEYRRLYEAAQAADEQTFDFSEMSTRMALVYRASRECNHPLTPIEASALVRQQAINDLATTDAPPYTVEDYLHSTVFSIGGDHIEDLARYCTNLQIPMHVLMECEHRTVPALFVQSMMFEVAKELSTSPVYSVSSGYMICFRSLDSIRPAIVDELVNRVEAGHPLAMICYRRLNEDVAHREWFDVLEAARFESLDQDDIIHARHVMSAETSMDRVNSEVARVIGQLARAGDQPAQVWLGRALELRDNPQS
jgi:hypothetical protein